MSEFYQALYPTPRLIEAPSRPPEPVRPGNWGWCGKVSADVLAEVLRYVESETGVAPSLMLSPSRVRAHARARFWAMYILRQISEPDGRPRYSMPAIGRAFGADHTSVLSGIRRHVSNGGYITGPNLSLLAQKMAAE